MDFFLVYIKDGIASSSTNFKISKFLPACMKGKSAGISKFVNDEAIPCHL